MKSAGTSSAPPAALLAKQHALFALRHVKYLPTAYQAEDASRMTLAYFCLASLALLPASTVSTADPSLSALQVLLKPAQRDGFIDWVYEQQAAEGGFRGSDSLAAARHFEAEAGPSKSAFPSLDPPNLIQTYTALLILGLLDDDFKRIDRQGLLRLIGACQTADGSFLQFPGCPEAGDPRSTYSVFAVASVLNDWSTIDVDLALDFLNRCRRYEGGFAQQPGLEANAGPTYCAIACFKLASRLGDLAEPEALLRWLVDRHVRPPPPEPSESSDQDEKEEPEGPARDPNDAAGFQGRANKPTDACYSFWNTGALTLLLPAISLNLSIDEVLDPALDQTWLLDCQHKVYGGIAREPGARPDVYHTYLSLAALALGDVDVTVLGMRRLDAGWNVPVEVAERMRSKLWKER
ncbi:geranylgeranyl transferase type-1 subunit beta [Rhodotorula toruloides]|uniref:Geranylgeranyl transferase type-1 subunit beta n=1 Tax=Rhodotorula toruloides TaxID=5286 RepID=A0A511KAQ4_RHOTO|nr:geranylgeranyl transferase type-1 subunit beta [Rhodotorula toruloides]